MRRTWKQQAFFLGGWTLAAAACLAAWGGGYQLGWVQGYESHRRGGGPHRAPEQIVQMFDGPNSGLGGSDSPGEGTN